MSNVSKLTVKKLKNNLITGSVTIVISVILGIYLVQSNLSMFINKKLTIPINLKAREYLKKGVKLNPSLKIYAFDDKTTYAHLRAIINKIDSVLEAQLIHR